MASGTLWAVKTSGTAGRLAGGIADRASLTRSAMASRKRGWSCQGGA